jgi:ubiquinone/menaquinone biosynthesis C-methylase UbiE
MKQFADSHHQEQANTYFHAQAPYWKGIYSSGGVYAQIHRERHAIALAWINELHLAPDARVLEIGCGAGYLAIALAWRGWHVQAIDSVAAMIEQARQLSVSQGTERAITERLSFSVGSTYHLNFEDASFDLVIALGVIPWLEWPELALHEMTRVSRPGGYILLTADNRTRLIHLLDPWLNPWLASLRRRVKKLLIRVRLWPSSVSHPFSSTFHSLRFIDALLARASLEKIRSKTLGFGPFTLQCRPFLPESSSTTLHHTLQGLADLNMPILRSTGAQYMVLARNVGTATSTNRPSNTE